MFNKQFDLSANAKRDTLSTAAKWAAWAFLLGLAILTGIHAVSITMAYTNYQGGAFAAIRVFGVVLAELFAVITAVLLATHTLRAKQKPVAIAVEISWFIFAAMNLISSFSIEHGSDMPSFVAAWVAYGLPIAALVIGALFYIMLRLDPDAGRADDEAELIEKFAATNHQATIEVLTSEQMEVVLRQMQWLRLPAVVGKQLGLTDAQITALQRQAPALLDLNRDGTPDILELPALPQPPDTAARPPSWIDNLRAKLAGAIPETNYMSNNTHAEIGQESTGAAAGQGERTPVYQPFAGKTPDELRRLAAELEAVRPSANGKEDAARPQ